VGILYNAYIRDFDWHMHCAANLCMHGSQRTACWLAVGIVTPVYAASLLVVLVPTVLRVDFDSAGYTLLHVFQFVEQIESTTTTSTTLPLTPTDPRNTLTLSSSFYIIPSSTAFPPELDFIDDLLHTIDDA